MNKTNFYDSTDGLLVIQSNKLPTCSRGFRHEACNPTEPLSTENSHLVRQPLHVYSKCLQ